VNPEILTVWKFKVQKKPDLLSWKIHCKKVKREICGNHACLFTWQKKGNAGVIEFCLFFSEQRLKILSFILKI